MIWTTGERGRNRPANISTAERPRQDDAATDLTATDMVADTGDEERRAALATSISRVYALGYSMSSYLRDKGYLDLVVVTDRSDYIFAEQICLDLLNQVDLGVGAWVAQESFETPVLRQNLFPDRIKFGPGSAGSITQKTTVLVLLSTAVPPTLGSALREAKQVVYIGDVERELLWQALLGQRLKRVREAHPGVPVLLWAEPRFPTADHRSSTEELMTEGKFGHYASVGMIDDLRQPGAPTPPGFSILNYSNEQLVEMLTAYPSRLDRGMQHMNDHSSELVNISEGHRHTHGQPAEARRRVWLFGGCIVYGVGCPDTGTLAAALQQTLSDRGREDFRIENWGAFIASRERYMFHRMEKMPLSPGDIIMLGVPFFETPKPEWLPDGCFWIDLSRMFERPHAWGESVFFDSDHLHERGQAAIALKIADHLAEKSYFDGWEDLSKPLPVSGARLGGPLQRQLDDYCASLAQERPRIGCIVMNCNPFTLGHQHLVERCAAKCDRLYVFVVEEDSSFFSFHDRMILVRRGTDHLDNVTVLPSGQFIISSITFSGYFGKEDLQDEVVDPALDVEIFADQIAPSLGITIRFAGEEPLDRVTQQYNDAMSRILPARGIEFEVLPRIEASGGVISASRVRRLLSESAFDQISELVPRTTLDYLVDRFDGKLPGSPTYGDDPMIHQQEHASASPRADMV